MEAFRTDFQLDAFLYFVYAGLFFCLLHAVVHALFHGRSLYLRLIADFLLAVFLCFLLFLAVYYANEGHLRMYMLFAFLLGMLVFHASIGVVYKKICMHVHRRRKKEVSGE